MPPHDRSAVGAARDLSVAVASSFTPAVVEALSVLKARKRELEKALDEVDAKIKRVKTSSEGFEKNMVDACKAITTLKSETDAMG